MAMSDSVKQWLRDLRNETELECMCVLQGKSLTKESTNLVFIVPKSARDHAVAIHQAYVLLKSEIKKFSKNVETSKWETVQRSAPKLNTKINSMIQTCRSSLRDAPPNLIQLQHDLTQDTLQLGQYFDCDIKCETPDKDSATRKIGSISQSLQTLMNDTLAILVLKIVENCIQQSRCSSITFAKGKSTSTSSKGKSSSTSSRGKSSSTSSREKSSSTPSRGKSTNGTTDSATNNDMSDVLDVNGVKHTWNNSSLLIDALTDVICVGLQSNFMCSLITKAGGVDVILEICRSDETRCARSAALRALATICCVPESIERFDEGHGVRCLTDILTDNETPVKVRAEAAGVVAQVTSPTLATCQLQMGFIENSSELVKSLTGLCQDATSHDVFLMSCAALANMTSLDNMTCDYMIQFGTASVLTEACQKNKAHTVFAKEQVVSVISNMTSVESCCKDLSANQRVIEHLVFFLNEHPRIGATLMELAACERVQQKSALAISQLSHQQHVAIMFVNLQCISRLVQLCKDPVQRNHSDAVLTTCIAALHKIFSICGPNHEVLKDEEEARRLVASRVLDSFVLGSSAIVESTI